MKKAIGMALLLAASFALAQSDQSTANEAKPDTSKDQVTVRGCLARSNGDYVLFKQEPSATYQLQPTDKVDLKSHLGERVEVTGTMSGALATSSDAAAPTGAPSATMLTVSSIKTVAQKCPVREFSRQ